MATTTIWKSLGACPPSSNMDPAARGGDRQVYYERSGEYCFRSASWGSHGTKVHDFRDYGPGHGCDAAGEPNGVIYPESEF